MPSTPKDEARAAPSSRPRLDDCGRNLVERRTTPTPSSSLLTKELIDVEKLASNLVGRAEDDAKAVAAAIEAAPAPADKNSDDAWAEARRLAEAARADADAASAIGRGFSKTPSRLRL